MDHTDLAPLRAAMPKERKAKASPPVAERPKAPTIVVQDPPTTKFKMQVKAEMFCCGVWQGINGYGGGFNAELLPDGTLVLTNRHNQLRYTLKRED